MTTSTSFAQMANNQSISLSSALRANTPPTKGQTTSRKFLTLSIFFLLSFFCTTNAWGAEVTFTASEDYSSFSGSPLSLTKAGVTVSGFGSVQSSDLRLFKGSTLNISSTNTISSIEFTFTNGSNNGGWNGTSSTYAVSGLSTKTWSKTATSGNSGKQARITKIIVKYESQAQQSYSVVLDRNGAQKIINNVASGTPLDDIDGTDEQGGCAEWSFVGWSKSQRSDQDDSTPMDLVTEVDGAGPYYAVYSHTDEGGGNTTATMSSFDAVSGNVNSDANVSYEAAKGTAGTAPAIYSNVLRIYQNGGTLTITGNNGKKLTSITIGSSMATSVSYKIDGGTESSNQSIAANGKFTLSEIEASSVLFTCKGTTSSSRLYLNHLSVTYSGGSTVYYTTSPSCTTETSVTLNPNEGSGTMDAVTTQNGTLTLPKCTFTREGYTFAGWATSADGEVAFADEEVVSNWDADITELYAQWTPETYKITLNANGGTFTKGGNKSETIEVEYVYGTYASYDEAKLINTYLEEQNITITRDGYTFKDWYNATSGGSIYKRLYVTEDKTIYAQWTQKVYTVTATSNNNNYGTVSVSGATITASPKTGYRVSTTTPYTISPSNSAKVTQNGNTFTVTPSANTTITINFEAIPTHKVSFNTGGLVDIESVDVQEGQTYNITQTPASSLTQECEYNTFVGWTKSSTTLNNANECPEIATSITMSTSDITLYAVYSKEETEEGGGTTPTEATLSFASTAQRTSFSSTQQVWKQNGIILTNNKSASTSPVADYSNPARFYASSEITIEAPGNITQMVATCPETKYTTALVNSVGTGASSNNNVVTIIPAAPSTTYTIATLTAQVQMFFLTVTYLAESGPTIITTYNSNPTCDICENILTINKGAETNGNTFTLSQSGNVETCDGDVEVVVTPTPAEHYSVSAVTATAPTSGEAPTVTNKGDGTWTVTYNQNSTGGSTINVTFVQDAKASITLSELGEPTTDNTTYYVGETYTLPSTSSQSCEGKQLVGWSRVEVAETDTKPTENYYERGAEVTLAATQTFYAVFATSGEGGVDDTDYSNVHTSNVTLDKTGGTNAANSNVKISEVNYTAVKAGTGSAQGTVKITVPAGTTKLSFHIAGWNGEDNKTISLSGATADPSSFKTVADAGVSGNSTTYTLSGTIADYFYSTTLSNINTETTLTFSNGGGNQRFVIWGVNASTGSGTSYSDYATTCVALPDPFISFVTTPADPIVFDPVNCGSTTSKAQAKTVQVNGENLQDHVTVEVTGPYKIARTYSTNLSDYTTSLTLDKTAAGAIHSNYQTVYIISTPPAQSTEATTGTLTFTTTKGNTLTVNLSTPTVTCTQYTLTLNDRGTKTIAEYYAGASVPKLEDPEGVCTDPIHYVFDGWAERTVANGSTEYTKVTFPYTMPGQNKTLYAVYRYLTSGGNGDYNLVTSALDDWSGDYLIAYNNETFADGTIGGEDGIGKLKNKVDLSSYISGSTIPATEGDKYNVTLEAVTGGYVLKTKDGKYNYYTTNESNGISVSTKNTADDYPITVKFVSQEEINLCLTGKAVGSVLRYNTTGYFRFYKNGGQEPVHLYKKASGTTLYTSAPVCGPIVEITSDKDIYITGGKGVHSTVVAQKKITFSATRLQPNAGGNAPSIKVPEADITLNGSKTDKVKIVDITQNIVLQDDGITYAGTGEITVSYTPTASNIYEDINVQLRAEYNTGSDVILDAFTIHARSLPEEFVIVAKSGDKWYALNGDMNNGSSANPANGQVTLDNDANPTEATYAPCNAIYTFDGVPNTGDRTRVRFQGTDGAWLWAASGTNVGIQNKSLKDTPEGNNKAYNWKLETEDNITYKFHNDNNSRLLGLNGEKFGMYASGVQDIRILPYEAKCIYNYAPTNLKVSVLKGSYVTLTWDAVAGATKYQYSTNGTDWTDCGTEPTATINGLEGGTKHTYYIRAYHEDAGVSQECIDYAKITFTTANCDDVPTNITYTADLNSITVSWTAAAPTATIKLFMNEDGTGGGGTYPGAISPYKISGGLDKNTTYYIQILAGGTCASQIIPVKTEDVEVDIVEWKKDGIIVDINTDETVGVTLENEVSYGSGLGTEATELFFSKYYEASYNVKLVAIYNGTKNIIDLTDYIIKYGKTSWESSYITLKDFGATKGQIQPGEEIILYSYTENNADDKKILDCVHEDFPDGNWVRVTSSNNEGKGIISFAGDKTLALFKGKNIIDIIGAVNGSIPNNSKANAKPSWGDDYGWNCATGLSIANDSEIGISTNRCLLVRNNTVTSGANAVASNITDFVTLCSEWKGAHVLDSDVDNGIKESCENFAYVGTFDYSDYYTKYETMGNEQVFDENDRNPDGTVTIPIKDLDKQSCRNIRIKLSNSNGDVLTDREYKVPIMITTTQGTAYSEETKATSAFYALQNNLAMIETDGEGNEIARHPLPLDEVREICKTCDVVVRDDATLMKMADDAANDHPQVRDIYVYENSSLIVPNGTNYTINNLSLRRKQDAVASLNVHPDALKLPESAAAPISLDFRLSAESWHWFTLPYDCNISEVTWVDGSPAKYNEDWFLMSYDGETRAATQTGGNWKAYTGTTIKAGEGFILAINGNINNPAHTYELRFPMAKEVLAAEGTDKTVDVRAWGVETNIRPNHKGWNLVGNPYLAYYQRDNINSFKGLRLGELVGPDPQTGYWTQTGDVPYVVVPIGAGYEAYEQLLASETDLLPFTAYFVQVGNDGTHNSDQDLKVSFDHSKLQLSATPMPASIVHRAPSEVNETEEPVIVGVALTNSLGESDKTSLVIADRFTNEYEMQADFFKWFGDYYKYYTKPVLYTIGADQGKRAFNALNEQLATQPIPMGLFAAKAGDYTFALNRRSDLSKVEEVWLHDANTNTYTNLMQNDYNFYTTKTDGGGRFTISVKLAPKVATSIDNVTADKVWATTHTKQVIVNGLENGMHLWLYDATGKLLYTEPTSNYQHTYAVPQTGTYFVSVMNGNAKQTIKVVVE